MMLTFKLQLLCAALLLLKLKGQHAAAVLTRLENLAIIKENTSVILHEFWNHHGSYNDPNNDKHLAPLYSILPGGNFRSYILDNWLYDPPAEIAVMALNNIGDIMFWLLFNTRGLTMDIQSWMTKSRLIGAFPDSSLNFIAMVTSWNVTYYQFVLYADHFLNKSWFAVGNFSNERDTYPQFLIPLSTSHPFQLPGELNAAHSGILEQKSFEGVSEFELDISGDGSPKYVTHILCEATPLLLVAGTNGNTATVAHYNMEYSDKPCGQNNRISYRDENGYIVSFEMGVSTKIETIYVSCMWITLGSYYKGLFYVFGPGETHAEFLRAPVLAFRGYWYEEVQSSRLTEAHSTTSQTNGEQTSSPNNVITDTTTGNIPTVSTVDTTISTADSTTGNTVVSTSDTTNSTADSTTGNTVVSSSDTTISTEGKTISTPDTTISTADSTTGNMAIVPTSDTTSSKADTTISTSDTSSTADSTTRNMAFVSTSNTTISTADTFAANIPSISTVDSTTSEDSSIASLSTTYTAVTRSTTADDNLVTSTTDMIQYDSDRGLNSSTTSSDLDQTSPGCVCTCSNGNSHILTIDELDEQIEKIKEELSLNKKELSSYSRTLVSIPDHRLSASCMGISAGVILGVIFAIIVILDISTFRNSVNSMLRKSDHS